MSQPVDQRILEEALRIKTQAGALAVLLAGSYARGLATPFSDVDLLAITPRGPTRSEVADVEWTTFDIRYTTMEDLEQDIAHSFVTCHSMLRLHSLLGDSSWQQRIETLARQTYPHFVPKGEALEELRRQVGAAAQCVRGAQARRDRVAQAQAGGGLVWLTGRLGLSLAGIGPVREDQWHELLRTAALPFDAATPLAQWYLGHTLDERLEAAWTLAEQVMGVSLPEASNEARTQSAAPAFQARALPDDLEAVELHRLIQAVGFGKLAKAQWLKDPVRQASEATVIVWFSVPACLALGGLVAPDPFRWQEALSQVPLPFDAARLYRQSLLGDSFEERKDAACTLGQHTMEALEPLFRTSEYKDKYRRT